MKTKVSNAILLHIIQEHETQYKSVLVLNWIFEFTIIFNKIVIFSYRMTKNFFNSLQGR